MLPFAAHAGLFSFVSGIFGGEKEAVVTQGNNSQNMALLQAALNPDPNSAKGGGDITIVGGTALLPESGPSGTLAEIEEQNSGQISVYIVRSGDSLSQIAKMFGVSVNTIIWANEIKGSVIQEGQRLVILPISGVRHTVKEGDTLQTIAKKYKADLREILQFNDLSAETKLAVGDTVIIPDGELEIPARPSSRVVKGSGGPSYAGYYIRPVVGGRKSQGLHGYNGIDLAAPQGTPILASAAGEVIISRNSGWNGGYGKYIVISHGNDTQTLYAHMSEVIVPTGIFLVKGQVIGYVGNTGKSTGSHLHFEVRGAKNPF